MCAHPGVPVSAFGSACLCAHRVSVCVCVHVHMGTSANPTPQVGKCVSRSPGPAPGDAGLPAGFAQPPLPSPDTLAGTTFSSGLPGRAEHLGPGLGKLVPPAQMFTQGVPGDHGVQEGGPASPGSSHRVLATGQLGTLRIDGLGRKSHTWEPGVWGRTGGSHCQGQKVPRAPSPGDTGEAGAPSAAAPTAPVPAVTPAPTQTGVPLPSQ